MKILRWLLVIPVAFLGWFLALFLGLSTEDFLTNLCPKDMIVSGACTAPWYFKLSSLIPPVFSGIAAVFVVAFPTLVAPVYRFQVSVIAFLCGAIAAFGISRGTIMLEVLIALAAGLLTVGIIGYLTQRQVDASGASSP